MQIEFIKRPWMGRTNGHGKRYNPDPFYQSPTWRRTKEAFKRGKKLAPDGTYVSNMLCYQCYIDGKITRTHTVDHIQQKREHGSATDFDNLQSLCAHCHAIKSANEGNERRKANTKT